MNRIDRFILACPSWMEFRALIEPLTQKEKGDLFERVTQLYLKTEPEYQAILTDVWLLREVDARTRAEIGLPRNDMGIDLIARCRDGRYWAIQTKYRTNEDHALGWDDLSTAFGLASAPRRNISVNAATWVITSSGTYRIGTQYIAPSCPATDGRSRRTAWL